MSRILDINLNERWADCSVCDGPTLWNWSLPVDDCGDLVPNDSDEWSGGVPACEECYNAHAEGLLTAANRHRWKRRMEMRRRALQSLIVMG